MEEGHLVALPDLGHTDLFLLSLHELNQNLFPSSLCLIYFWASINVFFKSMMLSIHTWNFTGEGKHHFWFFFKFQGSQVFYFQWTRTSVGCQLVAFHWGCPHLNPETCKYISLQGRKDLAAVLRLRNLRCKIFRIICCSFTTAIVQGCFGSVRILWAVLGKLVFLYTTVFRENSLSIIRFFQKYLWKLKTACIDPKGMQKLFISKININKS